MRCSYCYNRGHNKLTCPDYASKMEQYRALNPDDYRVVEYDYDRKKNNKRRGAGNSRCSWCGEYDHDRRKCEHYADSFEKLKNLQIEMRTWFRDVLRENKLGVGNVVVEMSNPPRAFIIQKIDLVPLSIFEAFHYHADWGSPFICSPLGSSTESWDAQPRSRFSTRRLLVNVNDRWNVGMTRHAPEDSSRIEQDLSNSVIADTSNFTEPLKVKGRRSINKFNFDNVYQSCLDNFKRMKADIVNDLDHEIRHVRPSLTTS